LHNAEVSIVYTIQRYQLFAKCRGINCLHNAEVSIVYIQQRYQETCDEYEPQHGSDMPRASVSAVRATSVSVRPLPPTLNTATTEGVVTPADPYVTVVMENVRSTTDRYGIADETARGLQQRLQQACLLDMTLTQLETQLSDWLDSTELRLLELSSEKHVMTEY